MFPRLSTSFGLLAMIAMPTCAQADGTIIYDAPLHVCADPDNLPYSNRNGEGFENKLAQMVAKDFGTTVDYTWFSERASFLKATLNAGECDVVMGYPAANGVITTRAYYRSGFVFVTRADRNLNLTKIDDPRLRTLKIGIPIVGSDGAATAPAVALAAQGIVQSVRGYPIYGPTSDGMAALAAPVTAVAHGDIDVAALWGPIAGYFAKQAPVPLRVTPIEESAAYLPQVFSYPISMVVRTDEPDLRDRLNRFIASHKVEIASLLKSYGVPLL